MKIIDLAGLSMRDVTSQAFQFYLKVTPPHPTPHLGPSPHPPR